MTTSLFHLLIDFALFGGLVLLAGCLALACFKQPIERLRIIEWTLAGCLVAPLLQQIPGMPRWSLGLWPRAEAEIAEPIVEPPSPAIDPAANFTTDFAANMPQRPMLQAAPPIDLSAMPPAPAEPSASPAAPTWNWSWPAAIVATFGVGLVCMGAWLAFGFVALYLVSRRSQPATGGAQGIFAAVAGKSAEKIRLAVAQRLALPIAAGLLRPKILLPTRLCETASDAELRFCLAHEYSHLRHGDLWRWQLCSLVGLVFFYQPLYWRLRRQLRLAQDYLADHAAAQTADPADYASFLITLAHHRLGLLASAGLSIGDGRSNLYRRVTMLLENGPMLSNSRRGWNAAFAILALLLIAGLSTIHTQADEAVSSPVSDGTKVDRYGDPIPAGAVARMGTVRLRHTNSQNGVAFSPDGKMLATVGWDRAIRIWNASTGQLVKELIGTLDYGTIAAAFSPDGQRIATVGDDRLIRVWNVNSGQEIWKAWGHRRYTASVVFSPDGRYLATSGEDGKVQLWDAAVGEELISFQPAAGVRDSLPISFSADGKLLACGAIKNITIYNLETGAERTIENAHGLKVFSVAFTPDGQFIASGGQSSWETSVDENGDSRNFSTAEVKLWSVADRKLIRDFGKGEKQEGIASSSIALAKDGSCLVSLQAKVVRVWKTETGELIRTVACDPRFQSNWLQQMALSPDGSKLASAGPDHVARIWDLKTGKQILSFPESHTEQCVAIACGSLQPVIASGSLDGTVRLWNMESAKLLRVLQLADAPPSGVNDVAFSPDGKFIAAGGYDWKQQGKTGVVFLWNASDGSLVWSKRLNGRISQLRFSEDGRKLAVAAGLGNVAPGQGQACTLFILNAIDGNEKEKWQGPASRTCALQFPKDGAGAVLVEEQRRIDIWRSGEYQSAESFPTKAHERQIAAAAFAPNRRMVVTSGLFDDLLVFWDLTTKDEVRRIQLPDTKGSKLAISPDEALLASASIEFFTTAETKYDRAIHLWNMATGEHVGRFEPGTPGVGSLTFSPDGRKLISGMNDGTLLVWDVEKLSQQPTKADSKAKRASSVAKPTPPATSATNETSRTDTDRPAETNPAEKSPPPTTNQPKSSSTENPSDKKLIIAGLDLSQAPATDDYKTIPDLYQQETKQPGHNHVLGEIFEMLLPTGDDATSAQLKYAVDRRRYYIQYRSKKDDPKTERTYGPFPGDPFERFHLDKRFLAQMEGNTFGTLYPNDPYFRVRLMLRTDNAALVEKSLRYLLQELDRPTPLHYKAEHLLDVDHILEKYSATLEKHNQAAAVESIQQKVAAIKQEIEAATIEIPDWQYTAQDADAAQVTQSIPATAWGKPNNGLRLAAVPEPDSVAIGERIRFLLVVENTSDRDIKFSLGDLIHGFHPEVQTADGKPVEIKSPWTSGWNGQRFYYRLHPGQQTILTAPSIAVVDKSSNRAQPAHTTIVLSSDQKQRSNIFNVRYTANLLGGSWRQSPGGQMLRTSPAKGEWSGTLTSGAMAINAVATEDAKKPADGEAEKSPADGKAGAHVELPQRSDLKFDIVVQRAGRNNNLTNGLPEKLGDRIKLLQDVKDVCSGSVDLISFLKEEDVINAPVNGWPPESLFWKRLTDTSGRLLKKGDQRRALLGKDLATKLDKKVGDEINLYGQPFEVVGIFDSSAIYEKDAVVILLNEFQRLTDQAGKVTGFTVEIKNYPANPGQLEALCKQIEALPLEGLPAGTIQAKPVAEIFRGAPIERR